MRPSEKDVIGRLRTLLGRTRKVNDTVREATGAAVHTVLDGTGEVMGSVKAGAEATGRFVYDCIDVLVGFCFILLGLSPFYVEYVAGTGYGLEWRDWACSAVDIAGGLAMMASPRRTCNRSIGIYAMIMGSTNAIGSIENLFIESTGLLSDIFFIYGLLILLFSLNLMASGVSYLRDRPRGTLGMTVRTVFLMMMCLADLYLMIKLGGYGGVGEVFLSAPDEFINVLMLFLFLVVMDTTEARESNWMERFAVSLGAVKRMGSTDEKSYVDLSDATRLCDPSHSSWTPVDDGGPAEAECILTVHGAHGDAYMTVQKWKGIDDCFVTVSDHLGGTMITATRFRMEGASLEDGGARLLIRGGNHFRLAMKVRSQIQFDDPEEADA